MPASMTEPLLEGVPSHESRSPNSRHQRTSSRALDVSLDQPGDAGRALDRPSIGFAAGGRGGPVAHGWRSRPGRLAAVPHHRPAPASTRLLAPSGLINVPLGTAPCVPAPWLPFCVCQPPVRAPPPPYWPLCFFVSAGQRSPGRAWADACDPGGGGPRLHGRQQPGQQAARGWVLAGLAPVSWLRGQLVVVGAVLCEWAGHYWVLPAGAAGAGQAARYCVAVCARW